MDEVQSPYFEGKLDVGGRHWTCCRCLGVKGSRVQISPARQVNVAGQPEIINELVPRRRIAKGGVSRYQITCRQYQLPASMSRSS